MKMDIGGSQLYDILENPKLWRQKNDQGLPGLMEDPEEKRQSTGETGVSENVLSDITVTPRPLNIYPNP